MQQYNIFQALFMSFYSKKLYRDVALNWGGKAFLYLLMLVVIASAFSTFVLQKTINQGYELFSAKIFPQIPEISLKNGKLITAEKRPYLIIDPDTKETIGIIDTSGKYTSLTETKTIFLATETELQVKGSNEMRAYAYPEKWTQDMSPSVVNQFVMKFISYLWVPIFFLILFGLYIYRIFQALIYALFGKIFALLFKIDLKYSQIVQIAMVAITPVIIVSCIQKLIYPSFTHVILGYFLLGMAYLFYGILANKKLS